MRTCPFCKSRAATLAHDDGNLRAYECQTCLAVERITKGRSSWWYHGWQQRDNDDRPGARIDGDQKLDRKSVV